MFKLRTSTTGFATAETLLVAVVIVMISGVGYFVYHTNQQADQTLSAANHTTQTVAFTKKAVVPKDKTADWLAYSSPIGKFNLKYPAAWAQPDDPEACGPNFFDRALFLGGNSKAVLVCASEQLGQMMVASLDGDQRNISGLKADSGYRDIQQKDVTVAGVKGSRITAKTISSQAEAVGGYPNGTLIVRYLFYSNGTTYIASYVQPKPFPDVLADFDLMVTKTLRFE